MVDPDIVAAWESAASESNLSLSAWIRLRCNGTELVAVPPQRKAA